MSDRATWADFVRWYADRASETGPLREAADMVETRNEAVVAIIAHGGLPRVYEMRSEWLRELERDGVEPPVDPTGLTAASVKWVVDELGELSDTAKYAAAQHRKNGPGLRASYNEGRHEAYCDAIRIIEAATEVE